MRLQLCDGRSETKLELVALGRTLAHRFNHELFLQRDRLFEQGCQLGSVNSGEALAGYWCSGLFFSNAAL